MGAQRIKTQSPGEDLLLGDYNNEIDNIYAELNNFSGANIADGSITAAKLANGANPEVFFGEIFEDEVVTDGLTFVSSSGLTVTIAPGTAYVLKDSTSPTKLRRVLKTLSSLIIVSPSTTNYIDLGHDGTWFTTTSTTVTTDATRIMKIVTDASSVTSNEDLADRAFGDNFPDTFGEAKGIVIRTTSLNALQMDAGFRVISEDGKTQIRSTSVLTADITASGAGGLDQGTEATDSWYAIVLISDSTNVTPTNLLLVSKTNWLADTEIIPTGFDRKRRVGYVRNTSSDFLEFQQVDNIVSYYEPQRLSTALNSSNFADISCDNFVSPAARTINLSSKVTTGNNTIRSLLVSEAGTTGSSGGVRALHFYAADGTTSNADMQGASQAHNIPLDSNFDFAARTLSTVAEIDVIGFYDRLHD